MPKRDFNYKLADSQGMQAAPIDPSRFDIDRYADYEQQLLDRNQAFWQSDSGLAVYRRVRVAGVFSADCADMEKSLALQLGGLQASMDYAADVANFLEPWYGIGTVASAFGVDYAWEPGQAPAVHAPFASVAEALRYETVPVAETRIGRHTLAMIEYFLDQTQGRLPMCVTDTQSPLNIASYLIESNRFYMDLVDSPDDVIALLAKIRDLAVDFTRKQTEMIGEAAVWPGHGFASSRRFAGCGASDDVMTTLSGEMYGTLAAPSISSFGAPFGGTAFHSCGNWARQLPAVMSMPGLLMVDGAFTSQTDPAPNPCEPFAEAMPGSGVVLNARMVGDVDSVVATAAKLYRRDMKLIVVTYCESPADQQKVYEQLRAMPPAD